MRLLDLHTHILPAVDDGAKDLEASVSLLTKMKEQGITDVVATPHFDATQQNLPDFTRVIRASYDSLMQEIAGMDLPHVYVGSEVFYFNGIGKSNGIRTLSMGGSKYFLLELPGCKLDKDIQKDIIGLRENLDLIPILAHIERYKGQRGYKDVLKLIESGVALGQINAASLLRSPAKRLAQKLIKNNIATLIATDSHSPDIRPPHMEEALQAVAETFGEKKRDGFIAHSEHICRSLTDDFYEE